MTITFLIYYEYLKKIIFLESENFSLYALQFWASSEVCHFPKSVSLTDGHSYTRFEYDRVLIEKIWKRVLLRFN